MGRGDKDQAALTVEVLQQIWYIFRNENKSLDISGPVVRKTLKSMEIVFKESSYIQDYYIIGSLDYIKFVIGLSL